MTAAESTPPQSSDSSSGSASDFTRLHISPLDTDLLKIVLPAAVAAQARNISYHFIETFPERRYGFVDLPTMEADKIKRKYNGSVLKGTKLRIEKARPEEREEPEGKQDQEDEKMKKKKKKSKKSDESESSRKRKRDRDVVEGVVLTDRKVKRGWTEPADQRRKKSKKDKESEKDGKTTEKKKRQRSKYTDQDECLLNVKLPLNAVGNLPEGTVPKKRKRNRNVREVTVHEFEKTTKFPSFLNNTAVESAGKQATEFVEGKGWVDEDGNVVENVKTKPAPKSIIKKAKKSKPVEEVVQEESDDDATSSSGTSSNGSSDEESDEEFKAEDDKANDEAKPEPKPEPTQEDEESTSEEEESPVLATPISAVKADNNRPMSASSTRSLTIKIPPPLTPSNDKVHPLEALYKRAKPGDTTQTPAQESKPFSFFGADIEEEEEEGDRPPVPMTPFTRQDIEWRNVRSAAPTPDTAHPTRMRNFWASQGDDDEDMDDVPEEEEEEEQGDDRATAQAQAQAGSSEFQTWFWENRRDLNRSWMNRRKTASKEKRHRENKARASKAV